MSKRKDRPLRVRIDRDVMTIEIGIDTLAFSYLESPQAWRMANPRSGGNLKPRDIYRIDDIMEFARDVKLALLDEEEDGSSMLSDLLDRASQHAVDEGSIAFVNTKRTP